MPLPQRLILLRILPLRIPLPRLQHQHPHQHQRQNGITSRQHLERILAVQNLVFLLGAGRQLLTVLARRGQTQTLDDIGDVDGDAAHVEDERGAVEEHVALRGPVEFRDEAGQTQKDDDVEDARD